MRCRPGRLNSAPCALFLLLGCAAGEEPGRAGKEPSLALEAQRVTATVKRQASRLVRLETHHEAILTTPEHPFATPGSGWSRAGRLAPGDWLVSERFGAVQILSVSSEPATRPVPVFNLSVPSSQAYFVGTDRVLVHNTNCGPSESREDELARIVRERDELNREIKTLTKSTPTSPRISELKTQRDKLRQRIDGLRRTQRRRAGVSGLSTEDRSRQVQESDYEALRQELEDAQKALAALEKQPPTSPTGRLEAATQKAELQRKIRGLSLGTDRAKKILDYLGELAQLKQDTPATDADRQALEEKKSAVHAQLIQERKRAGTMRHFRKMRATLQGQRHDRSDRHRFAELLKGLEGELANRMREAPSEGRDARVHHLADRIDAVKNRIRVRMLHERLRKAKERTQRLRKDLLADGKNTSEVDRKIEQLEARLHTVGIERAGLRERERLLARLDKTPRADAPGPVDETRLPEFERQLAAGLASPQQLVDRELTLDALDPPPAHGQDEGLDEAYAFDESPSGLDALMGQSPSAELESSAARLQQELREERVAVEAALSAMVNEYAHIQTTQTGPSNGPSWQVRLRNIQEEHARLRAQWRARLQTRLDRARQELHVRQSIARFRDEAAEAELARSIAVLERELQMAG